MHSHHRRVGWRLGLVLLITVCTANADQIELTNGEVIEGTILHEGSTTVLILTRGGRRTLDRTEVKKIVRKNEGERLLEQGDAALREGRYRQAEDLYRKASQYPGTDHAAGERMRRLVQAERENRETAEQSLRQQAEALRQAGQLVEAIQLLDRYLEQTPHASPALVTYCGTLRTQLAFQYLDSLRPQDALQQALQANAQNAPMETMHVLWAQIDALDERPDLAREELEIVREVNPGLISDLARRHKSLAKLLDEIFGKGEAAPPAQTAPSGRKRPRPPASPALRRMGEIVRQQALKREVDPYLVEAIICAESNYNPRARSRVGALGLMQLMPKTARDMGIKDPFHVEQNIAGGVRYLAWIRDEFLHKGWGERLDALAARHGSARLRERLGDDGIDLWLGAYNAGPGRVERYLFRDDHMDRVLGAAQAPETVRLRVPPYRETQRYIHTVKAQYASFKENPRASQILSSTP